MVCRGGGSGRVILQRGSGILQASSFFLSKGLRSLCLRQGANLLGSFLVSSPCEVKSLYRNLRKLLKYPVLNDKESLKHFLNQEPILVITSLLRLTRKISRNTWRSLFPNLLDIRANGGGCILPRIS